MMDPAAGGGASSTNAAAQAAQRAADEAARQAAQEAARRAAEEAARRAAAERARQAAIDRNERRLEEADGQGRYQTQAPAAPSAGAPGAGLSLAEAQCAAANPPATSTTAVQGDRWWEDPPLPGTGQVPVAVQPQSGASVIADNWRREAKADIGMGNPGVYDTYMATNAASIDGLADVVGDGEKTAVSDMLLSGDLSGYGSALVSPALAHLRAENPNATFRLLAVEQQALPPSGLSTPVDPVVIEMTNGGTIQQFVIQPDSSLDAAQYRASQVLLDDPALLEAWDAAARPLVEAGGTDVYPGDDAATVLDRATFGSYGGGFDEVVAGVQALPPEAQAKFSQDFAATFLRPLNDPIPADAVIVSVNANGPGVDGAAEPLSSEVNLDAVDGLASSTTLPPLGSLSQEEWRTTLDDLAKAPPASVDDLRARLEGAGVTPDELQLLEARDANALPAVLNLVQDHPPAVTFSDRLNLTILPGGRGEPATYESMTYDAASNSVVVETSLNRFIRDDAQLAENYGIGDVPMTIRIPLPAGTSPEIDWEHPTRDDFALLNGQIQEIDSASVFMHGYQSDRRVWSADMQQFMDLSPEPTIGIAFAGMGSEGDFLGSGGSPLTPKQYAFDTMEALDHLGLYGKDLTVYGHSMGGAAALQMGLATDRMAPAGDANRPNVNYVLLEPAPSGDSVPFLTQGYTSLLIGIQNELGSLPDPGFHSVDGYPVITGEGLAGVANELVGGLIIGDLMPGAPGYIQAVHASFVDTAGFPQLKATAAGLVTQAEPDPAKVAAFMRHNRVLVIAGEQDKIVSTDAVLGLFNLNVLVVPGNHYAHLPSTIPEQNTAASRVWPGIESFLNPEAHPARGPR